MVQLAFRARPLTAWIATRKLTLPDGKPVEVALGAPEETAPGHWVCTVKLLSDSETREDVVGSDAFQAMELGLQLLEQRLTALQATWFPELPGWHGFAHQLVLDPDMIDVPRFVRRVEEDVLREHEAALGRRAMARKP